MLNAKHRACTSILCLAVICKFWLIADMEITDDPDDPPNYIAQILSSNSDPSFFGPGTGWFGKGLYHLGIPFREGIEIFYLFACLLVVRVMFEWPFKSWLALGLFLFAYFNPVPEELFSHMESDQIWLVEALLGLSLFYFFVSGNSSWRWLCLLAGSLSLGLATVTRTSIIPLMASLVAWAALAGLLAWLKNKPLRLDYPLLAGGVACVALVGIFNYATCAYNAVTRHYFGISLVDGREYTDFYMTLQSVGDATGDKYYPVDEQRLALVAQAGPMAKEFVERMHTDQNFRRISQEHYGKFDFALPWFSFVVFFNTLPNGDLNQGFAMFKDIENEIAQAAKENRLKVRRIVPLPDCRIGIVLSAVPEALWRVGSTVTQVPAKYAWAEWPGEPHFENRSFSLALNRRTVEPSPIRESLGRALCAVYAVTYWPLMIALVLVVLIDLAGAGFYWNKIAAFSLRFLAQQLLATSFVVFLLWYVLFVASGLPASPRYVIFQNVLLPLLLVYHSRQIWQVARGDFSSYSGDSTLSRSSGYSS